MSCQIPYILPWLLVQVPLALLSQNVTCQKKHFFHSGRLLVFASAEKPFLLVSRTADISEKIFKTNSFGIVRKTGIANEIIR